MEALLTVNAVTGLLRKVTRVHKHFHEYGDTCLLQYFRFVPLKKVLGGPWKRQELENELMEKFGTRGFLGFNDKTAKIEDESIPGPSPAKRLFLVELKILLDMFLESNLDLKRQSNKKFRRKLIMGSC